MSDVTDADYTINDTKFAVVMVVDVSGSMSPYIDQLTTKFNDFLDYAKENNDVRDTMDLAVLAFGDNTVDLLEGFSDIKGIPHLKFQTQTITNMGAALTKANELARERTMTYKKMGIQAFKPWIILMTDGYPSDDITAIASTLRQREADGKIHVFALGMGEGFDRTVLQSIAGDRCFAIPDWNFAEFFSWLGKSVAQVSSSSPGYSGPICDVSDECQDMSAKFFGSL